MARRKTDIIRAQLGNTMEKFAYLKVIPMPPKGWLRAVRDALGMNGRQFAARLGVSPVRITRLESDEVAGALSLNTLRKAADALDCVLVYGLVPKTSLEDTVKGQAMRKAKEILRLNYDQGLSNRSIAGACNISPTTVSEYLDRASGANLDSE